MKIFRYFLFLLILTGCVSKSKYEQLLERELSSGVRFDSLFFDIKLHHSKQQFFDICREYNGRGVLNEGEIDGERAVRYRMNELDYPAEMNFYPKFYKDKLCDMQATFKYDGWAPWNKQLYSDHLQADVIRLLEKWYGKGFIRIESKREKYPAYVKVNGNRRISVFRTDDMVVRAFFTDLLTEKELKGSLVAPE
jgi:hypothetical protein